MMRSNFVKIIRNYESDSEEIQENVKARIQTDVSFFDLDVDIQRLDYVIIPDVDEPLVVEKVRVYDGRPPGHKEVILIKKSKFDDLHRNVQKYTSTKASNKDVIKTANNFTVVMYLNELESAINQKIDIPKKDKNNLIKKIREIKEDPYIESLRTTAVVDIKQIIIE
jgi:hypothetical protein